MSNLAALSRQIQGVLAWHFFRDWLVRFRDWLGLEHIDAFTEVLDESTCSKKGSENSLEKAVNSLLGTRWPQIREQWEFDIPTSFAPPWRMNFVTSKRFRSCSGVCIAMVAHMATGGTPTEDPTKGRATTSSELKKIWCSLAD